MAQEIVLVFTTWPNAELARAAAHNLVEENFAACGNLLPGVESIYRWEGKVETASEVIVNFKTTAACYPKFEERLKELHPYEVPEILALPVSAGLPAYLQWVESSCG